MTIQLIGMYRPVRFTSFSTVSACAGEFGLRALALILLVLSAALPSLASTPFVVTDTSDSASNPNSLRYAVNHAVNGDTINFSLTYPGHASPR